MKRNHTRLALILSCIHCSCNSTSSSTKPARVLPTPSSTSPKAKTPVAQPALDLPEVSKREPLFPLPIAPSEEALTAFLAVDPLVQKQISWTEAALDKRAKQIATWEKEAAQQKKAVANLYNAYRVQAFSFEQIAALQLPLRNFPDPHHFSRVMHVKLVSLLQRLKKKTKTNSLAPQLQADLFISQIRLGTPGIEASAKQWSQTQSGTLSLRVQLTLLSKQRQSTPGKPTPLPGILPTKGAELDGNSRSIIYIYQAEDTFISGANPTSILLNCLKQSSVTHPLISMRCGTRLVELIGASSPRTFNQQLLDELLRGPLPLLGRVYAERVALANAKDNSDIARRLYLAIATSPGISLQDISKTHGRILDIALDAHDISQLLPLWHQLAASISTSQNAIGNIDHYWEKTHTEFERAALSKTPSAVISDYRQTHDFLRSSFATRGDSKSRGELNVG